MLAKNDILGVELVNFLVFIITIFFWILTIVISQNMFSPKTNVGMFIYGGYGIVIALIT